MEFLRENLLKIVIFIGILIIAIVIFTFMFKKTNIIKQSSNTYSDMENKLYSAAVSYANDNPKILPEKENETNTVKLDTLIKEKYIGELYSIEDENIKCNGYVDINYNNGNVVYTPYLQCGKYYKTMTISDYIKENEQVVTSGDGLYDVGGSLVYKGEYPKNYLGIGERLYRILEISGKELRLISNEEFDYDFIWDDRYNIEQDDYEGINDYTKSRLKDSFEEVFTTSYFSEKELKKIIPHKICIGKRSSSNGNINTDEECQTTIDDQNLSLPYISDIVRASLDPNCHSVYDMSCVNYNYLMNMNYKYVTITATSDNSYEVYYMNATTPRLKDASDSFSTHIVVYLDGTSIYSSGNGTLEKPYTIR